MVTGLSTIPGTEEEKLIRNQHVKESVWEALQPKDDDETSTDPLETSSNESDTDESDTNESKTDESEADNSDFDNNNTGTGSNTSD